MNDSVEKLTLGTAQKSVVLISICFILFLLISLLIRFIFYSKKERKILYRFIKNYKKGGFLIVIIPAFLLYLAGLNWHFPEAVKCCVKILALDSNYDLISAYVRGDRVFRIGYILVFGYAFLSVGLFTASIIGYRAINYLKVFIRELPSNTSELCYVVGYSDEILMLAKSNRKKVIILGELTSDQEEELFVAGIVYVKLYKDKLFNKFNNITAYEKKNPFKRRVKVIVAMDDATDKMRYATYFANKFNEINQSKIEATYNDFKNEKGLFVYVVDETDSKNAYDTIVKTSSGRIKIINKYTSLAFDFVKEYPVTRYMECYKDNDNIDHAYKDIDISKGCVSKDLSINMIYVGFGKVNENIFTTELKNNALFTFEKDTLFPVVAKKINYYAFDKKDAKNRMSLNQTVFRLEQDKGLYASKTASFDDLDNVNYPLYWDGIKRENFVKMKIESPEFMCELRKIVAGENKYSYIHISIGSDSENFDIASKINQMLQEWKVNRCFIFVRIKNGKMLRDLNTLATKPQNIILFGSDSSVYNYDSIVNEQIERMTLDRHSQYEIINYIDSEKFTAESFNETTIQKIKFNAVNKGWYTADPTYRNSTVYAVLNIRLKLNLMGFDLVHSTLKKRSAGKLFVDKESKDNEMFEEFLTAYEEGYPRKIRKYISKEYFENGQLKDELYFPIFEWDYNDYFITDGKLPLNYSEFVEMYNTGKIKPNTTLRKNMASQEHIRWNNYLLANGYVPITNIDEALKKKKKDYCLRYHWNITDDEGLVKQMYKTKDSNNDLYKTDAIKYDFGILDTVIYVLSDENYEIIRKK